MFLAFQRTVEGKKSSDSSLWCHLGNFCFLTLSNWMSININLILIKTHFCCSILTPPSERDRPALTRPGGENSSRHYYWSTYNQEKDATFRTQHIPNKSPNYIHPSWVQPYTINYLFSASYVIFLHVQYNKEIKDYFTMQ